MSKGGVIDKLIIILILIGLIIGSFYLFFGKKIIKGSEKAAALEAEDILFIIEKTENGIVYVKNIGNKPINSFDCYIGGRKVNCETSGITPGNTGTVTLDKVKATILPKNSDLEIASGDYSEKMTLDEGLEIASFYEERESILPTLSNDQSKFASYQNSNTNAGQKDRSLNKIDYVSDEVIIKLKRNSFISSSDIKALDVINYRKILPNAKEHFKNQGLDNLYLLKVKNGTVADVVERFKKYDNIEYAEPNYIVTIDLVPNDPEFANLYGLHNTGQGGGKVDADIDASEAWDIAKGSKNVIVGVIDTGVDYNHPDLRENMWINEKEIPANGIDDDNNSFVDDVYGWDFANDDSDPFDDNGHGTHVSGTIGAVGNNSKGVVGVNWNMRIMALKFLNENGSGFLSDAIEAIQYATLMKADLTSSSWGSGGFSQAMFDAIKAADESGVLFVAAAGNSASDNDMFPFYPASYNLPNVIAVAATGPNDELAGFSNFGLISVHLGAPGVGILSTAPNGTCNLCSPSGYRFLSGTSMATPYVSGVAALIKAKFLGANTSNISHYEIKSRILSGVDQVSSLNWKTVTGGRLNALNTFEEDSVSPATIIDLKALDSTSGSVTLSWTAVGDDGNSGTVKRYDIRYANFSITDINFENATRVHNSPIPQISGIVETFNVTGLDFETTYFFAIKAIDNVGNKGNISNIVNLTTKNASIIFFDNFESGLNGWTNDSFWHLETNKSFSPLTSWTYNRGPPSYNYNNGTNSGNLTSPIINLTNAKFAKLIFYDFHDTEFTTFYDRRTIKISVNGSQFFDLLQLVDDPNNVWHQHRIDLSQYAGNIIQIRFNFDTLDPVFNDFWGWSIDDVAIFSDVPLLVQLVIPSSFLIKDSLGNPIVSFDNSGNLIIKGILEQNSNFQKTSNYAFAIRNNGNDVLVVENNGNMYIDGMLLQNQSALNSLENNNDFRIRNNGSLVAYINESGYIFLKGTITQNGNP